MNGAASGAHGKLTAFLNELRQACFTYRLDHIRDSVMVTVAVPDELWEVEFFDDAHVEVERFQSTGEIEDADALDRLLAEYAG